MVMNSPSTPFALRELRDHVDGSNGHSGHRDNVLGEWSK